MKSGIETHPKDSFSALFNQPWNLLRWLGTKEDIWMLPSSSPTSDQFDCYLPNVVVDVHPAKWILSSLYGFEDGLVLAHGAV